MSQLSGPVPSSHEQKPASDRALRGAVVGMSLALAGALWVAIFVLAFTYVPQCEEFLRDAGVALPLRTRLVINASLWLTGGQGRAFPGILIVVPLFLTVLIGLGMLATIRRARPLALLLIAVFGVAGFVLLTAGYASLQNSFPG